MHRCVALLGAIAVMLSRLSVAYFKRSNDANANSLELLSSGLGPKSTSSIVEENKAITNNSANKMRPYIILRYEGPAMWTFVVI